MRQIVRYFQICAPLSVACDGVRKTCHFSPSKLEIFMRSRFVTGIALGTLTPMDRYNDEKLILPFLGPLYRGLAPIAWPLTASAAPCSSARCSRSWWTA